MVILDELKIYIFMKKSLSINNFYDKKLLNSGYIFGGDDGDPIIIDKEKNKKPPKDRD